jgi:hypothetical protein
MTGKCWCISDEWINYVLERTKKGAAYLWSALITCVLILLGVLVYL